MTLTLRKITVRRGLPWSCNKVFYKLFANKRVRIRWTVTPPCTVRTVVLKLNTVAWVVELTYLHVVGKCGSLLGGHGKARCTVICKGYVINKHHLPIEKLMKQM